MDLMIHESQAKFYGKFDNGIKNINALVQPGESNNQNYLHFKQSWAILDTNTAFLLARYLFCIADYKYIQ